MLIGFTYLLYKIYQHFNNPNVIESMNYWMCRNHIMLVGQPITARVMHDFIS